MARIKAVSLCWRAAGGSTLVGTDMRHVLVGTDMRRCLNVATHVRVTRVTL